MRPFRPTYLPHKTPSRHCALTGKQRFRDEEQAKRVVTNARFQRRRIEAELAQYEWSEYRVIGIRRRECRCYQCWGCGGWHTTSRP